MSILEADIEFYGRSMDIHELSDDIWADHDVLGKSECGVSLGGCR